jgi:hypothetical protein
MSLPGVSAAKYALTATRVSTMDFGAQQNGARRAVETLPINARDQRSKREDSLGVARNSVVAREAASSEEL